MEAGTSQTGGGEGDREGSGGGGDNENFLFSPHDHNRELGPMDRDMYEGEDATTKMNHLMHSDTMILVISLIVMILIGLGFRSLCLRLSTTNNRKERMRGGLRQIAEQMNSVTRSMSNDLEQPDSARAVMRTYSNYGRGRSNPASPEGSPAPQRGVTSSDRLRVQAFSNCLAQEKLAKPSPSPSNTVSIEMSEQVQPSPAERYR